MTSQISQDDVNKAGWRACDTFRGTISSEIYKDYVPTMLFLKYLSDVWQDACNGYKGQFPGDLNTPRYVDTFEEEPEIDMNSLLAERVTLKNDLERLEGEMDKHLKELGYVQ